MYDGSSRGARAAHSPRRRRARLSLWHRFVLVVGYLAIGYGVVSGVIRLLVLLK